MSEKFAVVSYRNSTSNHNLVRHRAKMDRLYLIEILHQTTTADVNTLADPQLYLIEILHQTTTRRRSICSAACCILSKFYIKPQHHSSAVFGGRVVSYRNSTSNHNTKGGTLHNSSVVSYRNSTSNHNRMDTEYFARSVVSYRNSTSNHNSRHWRICTPMVVSYRNSTSNHNVGPHID